MMRRELSGWGRWPRVLCAETAPDRIEHAPAALAALESAIPRGLGRSYGDAALNPAGVIQSRKLDRMIRFDPETGLLEAEAGVSLDGVIRAFLPRGFFPVVTPGTRFVTLGGAIAADVHGKNHHCDGSFADHLAWIDLLCPDGVVRRCSAQENGDLFRMTSGAMGLTGMILTAAVRLKRVETGWMRQRTIPAPDLDAAIAVFEGHLDAPYAVAWIDCLAGGAARGRSLVYLGQHARVGDLHPDRRARPFEITAKRPRRVAFDAPGFALNRFTVAAFNAAYFRAGSRKGESEALVDWATYFHPLDAILDWNRIYGARGFAQYQCALPLAGARDALAGLLDEISAAGRGSFLAVLKRLGPGAADRPMSFPIEGYTLALDFPVSASTLALMDRLDAITMAAGGRLYLAKDSRMTSETLREGYGSAIDELRAMRNAQGGRTRMTSVMAQRLGL